MAKWGRCEIKGLKQLEKRLSKIDVDAFCQSAAKELTARLLAKVIKRTPVDTGELRRNWTNGQSAKSYAQSLPIIKNGDTYVIEIINPTFYSSFVEFGHRTKTHTGWVEGRFMLTKSEIELEAEAPQILENKLYKLLGEIFND